MEKLIESVATLDKQTAKDIAIIMQASSEMLLNLQDYPKKQDRLFIIVNSIQIAAKERVKELALIEEDLKINH